MTIDEQLNKFETDLGNFIPRSPRQQKLHQKASASLVGFRAYAEKEDLLSKEITASKEREMWLRRSVFDPVRKFWQCVIDENR
jgi:hypothetical protein